MDAGRSPLASPIERAAAYASAYYELLHADPVFRQELEALFAGLTMTLAAVSPIDPRDLDAPPVDDRVDEFWEHHIAHATTDEKRDFLRTRRDRERRASQARGALDAFAARWHLPAHPAVERPIEILFWAWKFDLHNLVVGFGGPVPTPGIEVMIAEAERNGSRVRIVDHLPLILPNMPLPLPWNPLHESRRALRARFDELVTELWESVDTQARLFEEQVSAADGWSLSPRLQMKTILEAARIFHERHHPVAPKSVIVIARSLPGSQLAGDATADVVRDSPERQRVRNMLRTFIQTAQPLGVEAGE